MESRRTRVTVPGAGDARARASRAALPLVLVGVAVVAVAVTGEGGVGRAHYLRQVVFGPAGPGVSQTVGPRGASTTDRFPVIPVRTTAFAARALARSPVHGHRARPRRRGLLGPGGLPRRARQPSR